MSVRSLFIGAVAFFLIGCSSRPSEELDADLSYWPECPDGGVVQGDQCTDPGGMTPCELIESRGGCPAGFHCDEELGCVEGVACGDVFCAPGELCLDGVCTCGGGECPPGLICAPVRVEDGLVITECVPPEHDGDGDGHAVGDIDGDGSPDDCDDLDPAVGTGEEEVCDGVDNDCDGDVDEGSDADGDGYTTCGTEFYGPDCDDSDPSINPGAPDMCRLGPDGVMLNPDCDCCDLGSDGVVHCDCCDRAAGIWVNPDCDDSRRGHHDWCPPGSQCCPGTEGCVMVESDLNNCGECGNVCDVGQFCVVGECRDADSEFEPDPDEGVVGLDEEPGPSNHPDVAWNWRRMSHWFSWWADWSWHWDQYTFWELDYGIAWVHQFADHGALLFQGRHFVSSPLDPRGEIAGAVESFLNPFRARDWYGVQLIDILEGEDTILCLAPAGGMGYGLVWSDGRSSSHIRFAAIGEYGAPLGWSQQITHGSGDHLYPRISWSPYYYFMGSGYGLVYQREEDDDVQVFYQQVQGYWTWWAPFGFGFQVSNNEGGAINPDIAWSPYGYGVVYVGAEDSNLYFALMSPFGGHMVRPVRITSESNVAAWRPSIAWNSRDGEFGIAFQATSPPDDNQDIYFMRTTVHGHALGDPVRLTSDPDLQRHPDMAWADTGYGITWYDRRSGTNELAFAYIDTAGGLIEGPSMLTDHGSSGGAINPAITYASVSDQVGGMTFGLAGWASGSMLGGGEFALVWRDEEAEGLDPQVQFLRLGRR